MVQGLPKALMVNGREEPIRWEYTAVLDAIAAMNDPDLEKEEKAYTCLFIIYENFEDFGQEDYAPAFEEMIKFFNVGDAEEDERRSRKKTVDFEQDYNLLIPAINKVAGEEIRARDDVHWWTFMSWFMEIGECTYSTVLTIRNKMSKGKPLEKWEQEWWNKNKDICKIRKRYTEEEKAQQDAFKALLGPR